MSWLARWREDLDTVMARDPAVTSVREAALYPHLPALWGHRLAHRAHRSGRPTLARWVSLCARLASGGVDIHPGARIGRRVFMDHPTGIVIGATAVVGDDVTLFQHVTLGARGTGDEIRGARRHPVLEDGVVVGANASVLGPVRVGAGAHIGAHALVLHDVPAHFRARSIETSTRERSA